MSPLLGFPSWLGTVVVVLILIAVGASAHAVAGRRPRSSDENAVAGIYVLQVGVLYAVLLAFVVVAAWEDLSKATLVTQSEQNAIGDLYRLAGGFPTAERRSVRSDILDYVRLMRSDEWPAMQRGGESDRALRRAERIAESIIALRPRSDADANVQSEALSLLRAFWDGRRQRLDKNAEGMPPLLWWSLWIGAVISLAATGFMRIENSRRQLAMTIVLAIVVGIVLSLAVEFEYPYRGDVRVPTTGWVELEDKLVSGAIK